MLLSNQRIVSKESEKVKSCQRRGTKKGMTRHTGERSMAVSLFIHMKFARRTMDVLRYSRFFT